MNIVQGNDGNIYQLTPVTEAKGQGAPLSKLRDTPRGKKRKAALSASLKQSNKGRKTKIRNIGALVAHIGLQSAGRKSHK